MKPARVFLSQEQIQILKLVEDGKSVFYTGSAGKWYFHSSCFASDSSLLYDAFALEIVNVLVSDFREHIKLTRK